MPLGSIGTPNITFGEDLLVWSGNFKLMGLELEDSHYKKSGEALIRDVEAVYGEWQKRRLTPIGKITIVRTLALSKITYSAMTSQGPSKMDLEKLGNLSVKFLGDTKPAKIARNELYAPLNLGGFNFPEVTTIVTGLKTSWFRKVLKSEDFWITLDMLYRYVR